jgi:hypothetical protein
VMPMIGRPIKVLLFTEADRGVWSRSVAPGPGCMDILPDDPGF